MKKIFLLLALVFFTCYVYAQQYNAGANKDSAAYWKAKCDTLNHENFILGAQVDWVQYYLALMQKRQKDTVYSRGWLIRAISKKLPSNPYMQSKPKPSAVKKKPIPSKLKSKK